MILGRSPALWAALVAAALNVALVLGLAHLSVEQVAALNGLALAFIGVIANESDPTTVPTFALATRPSGGAASAPTGGTTGSGGPIGTASAGGPTDPTAGPSGGGGA